MAPFIVRHWPRQRVQLELNGRRLGNLVLDAPELRAYEVGVPDGALQRENVLRLMLPDARSPAELGVSGDERLLAVAVEAFSVEK